MWVSHDLLKRGQRGRDFLLRRISGFIFSFFFENWPLFSLQVEFLKFGQFSRRMVNLKRDFMTFWNLFRFEFIRFWVSFDKYISRSRPRCAQIKRFESCWFLFHTLFRLYLMITTGILHLCIFSQLCWILEPIEQKITLSISVKNNVMYLFARPNFFPAILTGFLISLIVKGLLALNNNISIPWFHYRKVLRSSAKLNSIYLSNSLCLIFLPQLLLLWHSRFLIPLRRLRRDCCKAEGRLRIIDTAPILDSTFITVILIVREVIFFILDVKFDMWRRQTLLRLLSF